MNVQAKKVWNIGIYKINKLKYKILGSYYKFETKYRYTSLYMFSSFLIIIELAMVSIISLSILHLTDIIDISYFDFILDELPVLSNGINRQLVFAQLSITFIITSIFSLIITLKKEKVLGSSIYTITFARSIFGNIIFVSFTVFSILFLNIFLYLKTKFPEAILPLFLITLGVFSFFILKIILFTNNDKISTEKVGSIYLWENRKIIRKGLNGKRKQTFKKYSFLFNLNEDTVKKILKKEIEYIENFHALERVTNLALHNYKLDIQEYHLEWQANSDTIDSWIKAIQELSKVELYKDALIQYNTMLSLFIRHEVYISSNMLGDLLKEIIAGISSKKNKGIFDQNKQLMLKAMEKTMNYLYYKINNDFSYTRLGKMSMAYPSNMSSSFFVDYYEIVDKKLELNDLDKSKELIYFYEQIKLITNNVTRLNHESLILVKSDIIYNEILSCRGNFSLVGAPLSQLMITLIQEKKVRSLLYLLKTDKNDSIYFTCLIIATKLMRLYFTVDPSKKTDVTDSLMMFLIKLTEWDDYKIKMSCYEIEQEIDSLDLLRTYGYLDYSWETFDSYFLSIVKQSVMMKKKGVNINAIEFSNKNLDEIAKLFSDVGFDLLDKLQDTINDELEEEYGVFYHL
ncbi:MAG: hypothetical protein ABS939_15555 [Psychrobacillus sp.]